MPAEYIHVFRTTIKITSSIIVYDYIEGQYNLNITVQLFDKDQTRDAEFTALRNHFRNKR